MPGIGMPASLYLEAFGTLVQDAFDATPYHVGSSLPGSGKDYRDVDVRLLLDDEAYEAMGFGDPARPHDNPKWVAMTLAFSQLGRSMTGLPIDFQIQQRSHANAENDGPRSALGVRTLLRRQRSASEGNE